MVRLFRRTQAVEAIVNSSDGVGFLPLLSVTSARAIHGNGTYFARDARYSDGHARKLTNGQKQLLVADVITGLHCKGTQVKHDSAGTWISGDKMCPLLPGQPYARYNSLVDNEADPSIFVIQHTGQAYPAYLLTYHDVKVITPATTNKMGSSQCSRSPHLHSRPCCMGVAKQTKSEEATAIHSQMSTRH